MSWKESDRVSQRREFLDLAGEAGLQEVRIVARAPSTFLGEMYTGVGRVSQKPEFG